MCNKFLMSINKTVIKWLTKYVCVKCVYFVFYKLWKVTSTVFSTCERLQSVTKLYVIEKTWSVLSNSVVIARGQNLILRGSDHLSQMA